MSDAKAKFVGLGGERPDRYHKQSTKMLQHNGMMGWGIGECLFLLQILLFYPKVIQRNSSSRPSMGNPHFHWNQGEICWFFKTDIRHISVSLRFHVTDELGMFSVLVHYRHGGRFIKLFLGNWQ